MIDYYVSAKQAKAHVYTIKMVVREVTKGQTLSLPNWTPGSYFIRDFARHIVTINANAPITKVNSNTWEIQADVSSFTVEYEVYAYDLSVRGAYLDEEQAFINGSSLFLSINTHENEGHQVHFEQPLLTVKGAQIATTLRSSKNASEGWSSFEASSYDELIDHPVQIGLFERHEFTAQGIPHSLVISGQHDGDISRLVDDLKKICEYQLSLFGKPAPFDKYLFLLSVRKDAYGGLEHRSSTALQIQRDCLPVKGVVEKTPGYISLLALFSHEYFHAWNIKKIKPACFAPYDLNDKAYTNQLWAFEGITSYYDDLALVRSKVITVEHYLDLMAQNLTKLLRNPGRKKQTLLDSSFDAWIKFYQPNENSPNALVSYYLKGSIAAWLLDLALRTNTQHARTLDDVMKLLWERYGQSSVGVPEGAIEQLIGELGGQKVAALIEQALHTTDDLPFEKLLAPFGIETIIRQPLSHDDIGGKRENCAPPAYRVGSLHALWAKANGKIMITTVFSKGAAEIAGICPQDEIIAVNGLRVDVDTFDKIMKRYPAGQMLTLSLFRQDILRQIQVTLGEPNKDTVQLTIKKELTAGEENNLNKWLQHDANHLS